MLALEKFYINQYHNYRKLGYVAVGGVLPLENPADDAGFIADELPRLTDEITPDEASAYILGPYVLGDDYFPRGAMLYKKSSE